ncbi:hypothetical protein OROGR_026812 [Orobanche gracilis]
MNTHSFFNVSIKVSIFTAYTFIAHHFNLTMALSNNIIPIASIVKEGHSRKSVVAVRVLRIWDSVDRFNKSDGYEMILLDSEKSTIIAKVRGDIYYKFEDNIIMGKILFITNFKVVDYNTGAKQARINHPYKIEFGMPTKISEPTKEVQIPTHGFKFVRFNDVQFTDSQFTLDVVEIYQSHTDIESIAAAKAARKLDVTLKDLEGRELVAILWENYANEFLSFLETWVETDNPLMIALQFVAISKYRDLVRVQTKKNHSILMMDPKSEEITHFLNSVPEDSLIANSNDTPVTKHADWFTLDSSMTIKDLLSCSERIKLEAKDSTGQTFFILLDHQARDILKKSAADMLADSGKKGHAPEEFDKFFENEWIFRKSCEDSSLTASRGHHVVVERSTHTVSQVSVGDAMEEISSNSLLNCFVTPQKRSSVTLDGSKPNYGIEGYSVTKIPKKEK